MTKRIDLNKTELEKLYCEKRLPSPEIANRLGVSPTCVLNNLKRYGLKVRAGGEQHWGKEQLELVKQGLWKCWKCNKVKSKDAFTPIERHWMGHDYVCRECGTGRRKAWQLKNPLRNRASDINRRAKVHFVTAEDLENIWSKYNGKCYYCGKQLNKQQRLRGYHFDHVQNGIHKRENLVIACHRCNTLKRDATPEELMRIARKINEHTVAFA